MNRKRDSKNSAISRILNRIDPIEKAKTSTKMNIAAMIDDAMIAKGWSKKDLMEKMGKKNQSEITRWLSGTQNFTVDKLVELSVLLDIKLVAMYEEKNVEDYITVKFPISNGLVLNSPRPFAAEDDQFIYYGETISNALQVNEPNVSYQVN